MAQVIPLHHIGAAANDARAFGTAPPVELRLSDRDHDEISLSVFWFVAGCYCGTVVCLLGAWLS